MNVAHDQPPASANGPNYGATPRRSTRPLHLDPLQRHRLDYDFLESSPVPPTMHSSTPKLTTSQLRSKTLIVKAAARSPMPMPAMKLSFVAMRLPALVISRPLTIASCVGSAVDGMCGPE